MSFPIIYHGSVGYIPKGYYLELSLSDGDDDFVEYLYFENKREAIMMNDFYKIIQSDLDTYSSYHSDWWSDPVTGEEISSAGLFFKELKHKNPGLYEAVWDYRLSGGLPLVDYSELADDLISDCLGWSERTDSLRYIEGIKLLYIDHVVNVQVI